MLRRVLPLCLVAACLRAQDPTDAQSVFLDLEAIPLTQSVTGSCTWTFKSKVAGLTAVTLGLDSAFTVSNVTSSGLAAAWTRPANEVAITLDRPYLVDEIFTVGLSYAGTPASGAGFGSFSFDTHGSPPVTVISSLSEPFYAYTWWPVKDSLTDKFTTTTWFTVPTGLVATSNGLLQGSDALPGNRTRWRWQSNYPTMTYGVCIAASNYQLRSDVYAGLGGAMPLLFYAYPENFAAEQTNMDRLATMITTFSNLFGPYPFANEKYAIAQFNWGGGMEHQTMTCQAHFGETLSAHELGHSWWGNSVTCATWNDIGINEGFATYSEALWDEFKPGGGTSSYFSRMNANKPSSPGTTGSVFVTNPTSVGAIFSTTNVYRKGAWVLHQLRHVVGDATFFQILQSWQAQKQYQSATWTEFAASASATAGWDLTWLIDQCVMRTGAPKYNLAWSNQTIGGQTCVTGNVAQIHAGLPYRFPVDVRVTVGGVPTTHVVWVDQERDDFTLPTTGSATSVSLDPSPWILRSSTTTGTFSASLARTPSSIPRTGGVVTFTLDGGTSVANRPYVIGVSATGVTPGVTLPDGKVVPIVFDDVTAFALASANGPLLPGFSGVLDAAGQATAQLVLPDIGPIPGPITLRFAFATTTSPVFTSTPVAVTITP